MNIIMLKIISGAQTGVDRAALDAALNNNIQCGGWYPDGRIAEDGIIPKIYPVEELEGGGYRQRTRKSVQDSDGTVIIYFGELSGGTEKTRRYSLNEKKPLLLIDANMMSTHLAADAICEFFTQLNGGVVNFTGPRASNIKHAYTYTLDAVTHFIQLYGN